MPLHAVQTAVAVPACLCNCQRSQSPVAVDLLPHPSTLLADLPVVAAGAADAAAAAVTETEHLMAASVAAAVGMLAAASQAAAVAAAVTSCWALTVLGAHRRWTVAVVRQDSAVSVVGSSCWQAQVQPVGTPTETGTVAAAVAAAASRSWAGGQGAGLGAVACCEPAERFAALPLRAVQSSAAQQDGKIEVANIRT